MKGADFSNLIILVPAYEPTKILIDLVKSQLASANYGQIILVNDGSGIDAQAIFAELRGMSRVTVLDHAKNQGKGAAIKTGLNWILKNYPLCKGVITADADGQHTPEDIANIADNLLQHPNHLILGVRDFDQTIPWRSRFGNQLTRKIFRALYKIDIRDTQTGLRAIPQRLVNEFVSIPSNKYEYEMLCLIFTVKSGHQIEQVKINTIYFDHNKASHFNPIVDSVRIYYAFLQFYIIKVLAYLLDFGVFALLFLFSQQLFLSLLVARAASGWLNFRYGWVLNYLHRRRKYSSWIYLGIVSLSLLLSYSFLLGLINLGMNAYGAKLLVDFVLLLVSTVIQKVVFFRTLLV